MVTEGQPLVLIDPAPYRAQLPRPTANLEQAEASATNAKVTANRNRELSKQQLVSRMQLDDSEALERSHRGAGLRGARAGTDRAYQPGLRHDHVADCRPRRTPARPRRRTGRAERSHAANYRRAGRPHIRILRSTGIRFRAAAACAGRGYRQHFEGKLATLQLVRPDGTFYEEKGTLDFSDYAVNPVTGAVAFRGRIANPQRSLLPGMFVNVRLTAGVLNKGFEVPQLAVQRDGQGPYALVVAADGKVLQKRVETSRSSATTG
jgi:membrane fusion protein (multidrug efflux system)